MQAVVASGCSETPAVLLVAVLTATSDVINSSTWRLLCSSFLVETCFFVRGFNVPPKKELHRGLQVVSVSTRLQWKHPAAMRSGGLCREESRGLGRIQEPAPFRGKSADGVPSGVRAM